MVYLFFSGLGVRRAGRRIARRYDGRVPPVSYDSHCMVKITFQDRATERKALAFLLGQFSGGVLKGGEHLVPQVALEALARENIPFTVKKKAATEGGSLGDGR